MKYKYRKHRKVIVAAAVVLSASIFVTGTYAWRSISQEALNEDLRTVNPGGRLHDDFNGENKDVYAENFMSTAEGGVPIYVRIRLDEYMEWGSEAGKTDQDGNPVDGRKAESVVAGAKMEDKSTWSTYKPNQSATSLTEDEDRSPFYKYWKWKFGGETIYMPTFNKNKDSLAADINGTWETIDTKGNHYADYVDYSAEYKKDPTYSKTGDAVYDADEDDEDEKNPVEGTDITTVSEKHSLKKTQSAMVMTMKQWLDFGAPVGNFWVYDSDGWAYWAAPLQPGETTGLLLDGIVREKSGNLDKNCYYAINVVSQFATKDDLKGTNEKDGFYYYKDKTENSDGTLTGATQDALYLLNLISNQNYKVTVKLAADTTEAAATEETAQITTTNPGGELEFAAMITCMDKTVHNQNVTWSVVGNSSKDTKIDSHGVLTVGADELDVTTDHSQTTTENTEAGLETASEDTKTQNSKTDLSAYTVNGASKDNGVGLLTIRATDANGNVGECIVKVVKQ